MVNHQLREYAWITPEFTPSYAMASIRKRGAKWRAELSINGERDSQTFDTKGQAVAWAQLREAELLGKRLPDHTLREALERYAREVAPTHKGERWEALRCRKLARAPMASKRLQALTATDLAQWRDDSLRSIQPASVRREMVLLGCVFDVAIREWRWLSTSPMVDVKKPMAPASRKRRITAEQVAAITAALGYAGGAPVTQSHRVALAFHFALETAMRAGEILGLRWSDIRAKAAELPQTKNGDHRAVPLTIRAREILGLLPRDSETVFGLKPAIRDALFRKARDKSGVGDITFHDSRAEAIWRLSKKLDVMELARVIGHRDIRSLLLYYSTSADELADRLG